VYKVLQPFKCRHQNNKVFKVDDEYKSVDKEHTQKLIDEKYIKECPQKPTQKKRSVVKEKNEKK